MGVEWQELRRRLGKGKEFHREDKSDSSIIVWSLYFTRADFIAITTRLLKSRKRIDRRRAMAIARGSFGCPCETGAPGRTLGTAARVPGAGRNVVQAARAGDLDKGHWWDS